MMHIHTGHNAPGCLPESDVFCTDDLDSAVEALRHELKDQQDSYYEQCTGPLDDGAEPCECAWCDVATKVEAALSAIADGDAAYALRNGMGRLHVFRTPEGPDMAHWIAFADGDPESCEVRELQEL